MTNLEARFLQAAKRLAEQYIPEPQRLNHPDLIINSENATLEAFLRSYLDLMNAG